MDEARRVAVIGLTRSGRDLARHILASPWMGLNFVGFYDDRDPTGGRTEQTPELPYLGRVSDPIAAARDRRVEAQISLAIGEAAQGEQSLLPGKPLGEEAAQGDLPVQCENHGCHHYSLSSMMSLG